jgi:PPM family protein phosphatase
MAGSWSGSIGSIPARPTRAARRRGDERASPANTVGTSRSIGAAIDIERIHLDDRDRVMLCTNGLTDALAEDENAGLLESDDPPNDQCRAPADKAIASGGEDDVTALFVRYRIPPL